MEAKHNQEQNGLPCLDAKRCMDCGDWTFGVRCDECARKASLGDIDRAMSETCPGNGENLVAVIKVLLPLDVEENAKQLAADPDLLESARIGLRYLDDMDGDLRSPNSMREHLAAIIARAEDR